MAIDPIPYHTMLHVVAYTTMYWHAVEAEAHCAVVRYIVTLQSSLVTHSDRGPQDLTSEQTVQASVSPHVTASCTILSIETRCHMFV